MRRGPSAGFTMIEVLVAFFVLALLTVTIQSGIAQALGGTRRAESRLGASLVARSLLSAPLPAGALGRPVLDGRMNGYAYRMRLEPLMPETAGQSTWQPVRVSIAVSRVGASAPLAVTQTIRLIEAGS